MKLFLIFALGFFFSEKDSALIIHEDFKSLFKIVEEGEFVAFTGQKTRTVHLSINLKKKNGYVQLQSRKKFYLFVNASLVAHENFFKLNVDSLRKKISRNIFLSIYQKEGIDDLSATWLAPALVDPLANPLRKKDSFNNFILISTITLICFFTALLRTNPQLTLDYLNVVKLFSLRDRDESQVALRITSSVNFLFYSFAGLLTSLGLLVAIHFSNQGFSILRNAIGALADQYFILWFFLALIAVALLMIKLGLAKIIALLFGWKDTAEFQFFHFVRVLVLTLFLIGTISIFCFSVGINANYYFFIKTNCVILSLSAGLLYFKLLAKAQFNSFHLFSYLCATEFIPLVILIKVFLN